MTRSASLIPLLLSLLPLTSCAIFAKKPVPVAAAQPGPTGGSEVDRIPAPEPGIETIAILGLNDVHGSLAVESARTREAPGVETIPYQKGGAAILATHVKILKKVYGDRMLILDAG